MKTLLSSLLVSTFVFAFSFNSWAVVGGTCGDYMRSTAEELKTPNLETLVYNLNFQDKTDFSQFVSQMEAIHANETKDYSLFTHLAQEWAVDMELAVKGIEFGLKDSNLYESAKEIHEFRSQILSGRALYLLLTDYLPRLISEEELAGYLSATRSSENLVLSKLKSLRELEIKVLSKTYYVGSWEAVMAIEFPGLDPKTRPFNSFSDPKEATQVPQSSMGPYL